MQVAILVFGVIAALAAVGAVGLPLWQQRTRLELVFRDGFSTSSGVISLPARVENRGRSPAFNVELFAGPPGLTFSSHQIGVVTVQPGTSHDFTVDVQRPERADLESGSVLVELKVALIIAARYGRQAIIVEMPAGPFSSERAQTKRHHRRWP